MNLEKKLKKNFKGIYKACGNKFLFTCGSYLINGYKYKYDKRMLAKQLLLYNLAKKNPRILEVGVYMGHSILIMLSSNPNLKITCIDIDKRFAPKAISYLKNKFQKSKIDFFLGDSIKILKKMKSTYDLYHIDGDHRSNKIFKEILACINIHNKKIIKILFDDVDNMKDVEKILFNCFKIRKHIKPKSSFRNLYVEIELNTQSINKFKKSYYIFLVRYFFYNIILLFIKKLLRFFIRNFVSKALSSFLGSYLLKNFKDKKIKLMGKKLKKVKNNDL